MRAPILPVLASFAIGLLALAPSAAAQAEGASGLGIGVTSTLTGQAGPSATYQTDAFHIEGLLSFADVPGRTDIGLAGRFWWHLHHTTASDFSVGGGLGIVNTSVGDTGGGDDQSFTDIDLELGAQIRAFVAPNVALGAALGFGIVLVDGADDRIALAGNLVGTLGITYFFF